MTELQIIIIVLSAVSLGAILAIIGGMLGAYAVFRTRHATTDIPFIRSGRKKDRKPASYVSDLFEPEEIPKDEQLSEAAQRLHEQKGSRAAAMAVIKGKTFNDKD